MELDMKKLTTILLGFVLILSIITACANSNPQTGGSETQNETEEALNETSEHYVFRDNYVIEWKDSAFESLIREYLEKESEDIIYYDDVKNIRNLQIWGHYIAKPGEMLMSAYGDGSHLWFRTSDGREGTNDGEIETLVDLEHFTSLMILSINMQENIDISAFYDSDKIDCLKRLTSLTFVGNRLTDISPISNLTSLELLRLDHNSFSDITPIASLVDLKQLYIHGNRQPFSSEPLAKLKSLDSLWIGLIHPFDYSALIDLPELKRMCISSLLNSDYTTFAYLAQLDLDYLQIVANEEVFQIVTQMETLKELHLRGDSSWFNGEMQPGFTSIAGIEKLQNLTYLLLEVRYNIDISPISGMNVEVLQLYPNFPEEIDLTPIADMPNLKQIIIPNWETIDSDSSRLAARIRELLPDIEITSSRYPNFTG